MGTRLSPLRYPGGKAKQYFRVKQIIQANDLLGETYIEPFAGGAGLALNLLMKGDVKRIILNDSDVSIYSFWYSIINNTDDFCEAIENVEISVNEWEAQKQIFLNPESHSLFELGFATFYLNRTNYSGIIKGGVLGGREQDRKNTIDVRFNKLDLIQRIRNIQRFKDNIILYNLDIFDFFDEKILNKYYKTFINFDPPYVKNGKGLYNNFFKIEDHERLFQEINKINRKWIVTYDTHPIISQIYINKRIAYLDLNYSLNSKKKAKEFIIFSDNLIIPDKQFDIIN